MSDSPVVLETRVVTGAGGGPEKTILNSHRHLESAGYRVLCAYMHPPGDPGFERLRGRAESWGARLFSVPDRGPLDPAVLPRMLALCRKERVAIWHAHDYKSNLIGLLLRPFWPMRLVSTAHGWVEQTRRTPLYYAVDRLSLPRYELVIGVSPDLRARCLELGVSEERCLLIENGVDTDRFRRRVSPAEAKRRLGLPADRPVVGAVGRLSPEKGFDLLIRAADRLMARGLDFELVIAGEGAQRPEIEALIAELGRGDRICLLGYVEDNEALFQALDVFALSSLREGLPNVLLEAMAIEVPVVATRIAGVPRLVSHGENGLLIEPGSVDALADALGRLLAAPDLARRLGLEGRSTVEAGFSFEARMGKIRHAFDRLMGREAAPANLPTGRTLTT